MGNLLEQAQEMQRQLDRARSHLAETRVEGFAGDGAVRVVATCDRRVHEVHISDALHAKGDKDLLEDLVNRAVGDALSEAEKRAEETLSELTGGMKFPGLI